MSERLVYRPQPTGFLATTGHTDSAQFVAEPIYEGLVVDVILDRTHAEYAADGYNIGAIKVRIFSINHSLDNDLLPWADPIENNMVEIPLLGELVILHKVRGNFFYTRKLPVARRMQENGMLKLNDALNARGVNTLAKKTTESGEVSVNAHKFGEYFKPDSRVRQLKHFEGDTLLQGRMGHSIRFGSSQIDPQSEGLAPNILLRTGQGKGLETDRISVNSVFGYITEDINKDATSIWMTSDQMVPFVPATTMAGSSHRSVENSFAGNWGGAQLILNSDRILLNAKKTHIQAFSNEGIHLNSFKDTTIDTDRNIILTANIDIIQKSGKNIDHVADQDITSRAGADIFSVSVNKTSFLGKKIFLGSVQNDSEPFVGGSSLSVWLGRLILTLMGNPPAVPRQTFGKIPAMPPVAVPGIATTLHTYGMSPGALSPAIVKGLSTLYKELQTRNSGQQTQKSWAGAPFSSRDNFVMLQNENPNPSVVKNDFVSGEQMPSENNKWILSDPYYTVL